MEKMGKLIKKVKTLDVLVNIAAFLNKKNLAEETLAVYYGVYLALKEEVKKTEKSAGEFAYFYEDLKEEILYVWSKQDNGILTFNLKNCDWNVLLNMWIKTQELSCSDAMVVAYFVYHLEKYHESVNEIEPKRNHKIFKDVLEISKNYNVLEPLSLKQIPPMRLKKDWKVLLEYARYKKLWYIDIPHDEMLCKEIISFWKKKADACRKSKEWTLIIEEDERYPIPAAYAINEKTKARRKIHTFRAHELLQMEIEVSGNTLYDNNEIVNIIIVFFAHPLMMNRFMQKSKIFNWWCELS